MKTKSQKIISLLQILIFTKKQKSYAVYSQNWDRAATLRDLERDTEKNIVKEIYNIDTKDKSYLEINKLICKYFKQNWQVEYTANYNDWAKFVLRQIKIKALGI